MGTAATTGAARHGARPPEGGAGLLGRLDGLARRGAAEDAERAVLALLGVVLGLLAIGLLVQASHAATTVYGEGPGFHAVVREGLRDRGLALLALVLAYRLGPVRLRPFVPLLVVVSIAMLVGVFVPGIGAALNGARRWITIPGIGLSVQPSEVARVVLLCWVADRCTRLGDAVLDARRGVLPILAMGLTVFGLILVETDLGGSLLFLLCFLCTMWVGGARPVHVATSLVALGGGALLVALSRLSYVRGRLSMWMGNDDNDQVSGALAAMASGDLWGVGLGQGRFRTDRVPYLDSDYVLAQVGEELGWVGTAAVLILLLAFTWQGLRLVLAIRDRYRALAAFGLLSSVAVQAMLHVQVVTGLAPPKGINLPFVSSGGTSLVVSALAVGLALGAARPTGGSAPRSGRGESTEPDTA